MNSPLPGPSEFAFCAALSAPVVETHKALIREFLRHEEQLYKLTFKLFPLFMVDGLKKDLLSKMFCDAVFNKPIIISDAKFINELGPYTFDEYWLMAFKPAYWPENGQNGNDLLEHSDVVQKWRASKVDEIMAIKAQLDDFREKLQQ